MTKWSHWPNGMPLELDNKPLTIRFLDFGGQEIMHSMHRCFLTNHTVYVIVCESRDDAEIDSVVARWMETVKSFAPECPVILALNKSDLNPHVTVNERPLKAMNPNFRFILSTSAKRDADPGIDQLTVDILSEVPNFIRKMRGNAGFLKLKEDLENLETDYILPSQFRERCDNYQIKESMRQKLLNWFQDLGVAYTYTSAIQEVYVLNPAWLTNGIYRLILRTENGGFLHHSAIRDTLGNAHNGDIDRDKVYSPQEMEFILHVMRKFEISMKVTPDHEEDGIEMIPMKMCKTPPSRYDEFDKSKALHLRWEAGYLPNNLVHRLIIRKYPELDPDKDLLDKCVWRTGGWFRCPDGSCDALVELADHALDVYVRGVMDARVYMDSFRQQTLRILGDLNIKAEEFIYYTVNGKTGRIPYSHVSALRRREKKEIFLGDIDEIISVERLLRENYMGVEMETRDFFISYNNTHDGKMAKLIADTLRDSGYTVYYQGYDCEPGMNFVQWMADAIAHSYGFIAVWSTAYEESDFCRRELSAAVSKQHRLKEYRIIPVRVEDIPITNALFQAIVRVDLLSDDVETNQITLLDALESSTYST